MRHPFHVVWDWNGTLLDDLEVVIEATNVGLAAYDVEPLDEDRYRDHFTRPVRVFYDSLFGRPVSDMEWELLNKSFHDEYYTRLDRARLTGDATSALRRVSALGWSQSLLSMSAYERLVQAVMDRGIFAYFNRVDGLSGATGGLKTDHLISHLDGLDIEPERVLVVGDTPDDVAAARNVGAWAVIYDGGSHHMPTLEAQGAPIAHSLEHAVDLAESIISGTRSATP